MFDLNLAVFCACTFTLFTEPISKYCARQIKTVVLSNKAATMYNQGTKM